MKKFGFTLLLIMCVFLFRPCQATDRVVEDTIEELKQNKSEYEKRIQKFISYTKLYMRFNLSRVQLDLYIKTDDGRYLTFTWVNSTLEIYDGMKGDLGFETYISVTITPMILSEIYRNKDDLATVRKYVIMGLVDESIHVIRPYVPLVEWVGSGKYLATGLVVMGFAFLFLLEKLGCRKEEEKGELM